VGDNMIDAWIIEEYDSRGSLVWSMLSRFEPSELSWFKDLKNKTHNLKIIPLIRDEKNIKIYEKVKKYDSSKMVVGL
jgi:hypothetical protein